MVWARQDEATRIRNNCGRVINGMRNVVKKKVELIPKHSYSNNVDRRLNQF